MPSILFSPALTLASYSHHFPCSTYLLWLISHPPKRLTIPGSMYPRPILSKDSRPCHCRLVEVAAPYAYKLVLYLELGLKPDLVYNPSVASTVFSVASITLCFTLILFSIILTIRLRLCLSLPLQIALIATLKY